MGEQHSHALFTSASGSITSPASGSMVDDASDKPQPAASHLHLLDPLKSERLYRRDPFTGTSREIWRPGDGDGVQGTDYFDRQGGALPLDQRWRFFQSDIGPIGQFKARPPKHVMLDDRAVWEVIKSDIPRSQLTRNWEHDFAGQGKIRVRRAHRGRSAIKDSNAEGDARYHSAPFGPKNTPYFFTGEKDYEAVVYSELPRPELTEEELQLKRRAESPPDYNPRAHGHNQHTPRDMLVKHGAPTFSKKRKPELDRIPRFTPKVPRGFGQAIQAHEPPAIKRKTGKDTAISIEGQEGAADDVGAAAPPTSTLLERYPKLLLSNGPDVSPFVEQSLSDHAANSSSDEENPLGGQRELRRIIPSTAATVARLTQDIPRQMSYIERCAHEQKLADELTDCVENKEDVERMASELAEAHIRLIDQGKEIGRLNVALTLSQTEVAEANAKVFKLEAEAAGFDQTIQSLGED